MFSELRNEARITFNMKVDSPFRINSGMSGGIDPTLPDMKCLRSLKNGNSTVVIPGSSIKGVIRSRCEKIISLFGGSVHTSSNVNFNCDNRKETYNDHKIDYEKICDACRMFGSCSIAGRVKFKDAYPIGDVKIGIRNSVRIDRITGGSSGKALFDMEVVEDGKFSVEIELVNYELYQLKILMYAINDINEGYVAFGSGTTRGNGRMKVEDLNIQFRDYRKSVDVLSDSIGEKKINKINLVKELFYKKGEMRGLKESIESLDEIDVEECLRR